MFKTRCNDEKLNYESWEFRKLVSSDRKQSNKKTERAMYMREVMRHQEFTSLNV